MGGDLRQISGYSTISIRRLEDRPCSKSVLDTVIRVSDGR
jgi:hypothetical protein